MKPLIVLALCLVPAIPATAAHYPDPVEPKMLSGADLTYRRDGADLIVSMSVTVFDAPHVVLTSLDHADTYIPILRYTVLQNADHALQGKKTISIEWRFKDHAKSDARPASVKGLYLALYTEELKQLGGSALKLTKDW